MNLAGSSLWERGDAVPGIMKQMFRMGGCSDEEYVVLVDSIVHGCLSFDSELRCIAPERFVVGTRIVDCEGTVFIRDDDRELVCLFE